MLQAFLFLVLKRISLVPSSTLLLRTSVDVRVLISAKACARAAAPQVVRRARGDVVGRALAQIVADLFRVVCRLSRLAHDTPSLLPVGLAGRVTTQGLVHVAQHLLLACPADCLPALSTTSRANAWATLSRGAHI